MQDDHNFRQMTIRQVADLDEPAALETPKRSFLSLVRDRWKANAVTVSNNSSSMMR